MMSKHSERQFAPYSSHIFQTPETFITRHNAGLPHCPPGSTYIPPTDDEILANVLQVISNKSQSTDDIAERVGSPVIETSSTSTGDIPERVSSPVTPCDSTVDDETLWHFQNDEKDDHTRSRPSEMRKGGTWSIQPVAEEMEDDLYCMTDLPREEALKILSDTQNKSDLQYEDVTDEEGPQMDMNPLNQGESVLEPACKCPVYIENDDGDFVPQPCPACVKKDATDIPSVDGVLCNPAAVNAVGFLQHNEIEDGLLKPQQHEESMVDESPSVNAHEWGNETEDELEDDDWIVIGPIGISSLKYIPPDVVSKSIPASSQLEVFDDMDSFKEAKGIHPDRIHDIEVNQSNTGTAVPIAPSRSKPPFGAVPRRSPQQSIENGSEYPMPQKESSSDDSDFSERKVDRRKVKRRKRSKSQNMFSEYSESKAERDQQHNKPADCQKGGLSSLDIEGGPCTPQRSPQYNSSETENSSDCSISPLQRNRLTVPNPSLLFRSISNSESGVHDNVDAESSSPVRRSMSHEPETETQKIQETILKTPKHYSEKKEAKNGKSKNDKEENSGRCRPELEPSRRFKSRQESLFSESTVNSGKAREKPTNSRQSSAVLKANGFKPREGPTVSKEGPRKSSSAASGIRKILEGSIRELNPLGSRLGKKTSVGTDEEKTRTVPGPLHYATVRQRHNSQESAPGQRLNAHASAPGPRLNSRDAAPRQRHNSQESTPVPRRNSHGAAPRQRHSSHGSAHPLRKKTMEQARGETKRKSTPIHPTEQSGSKDLTHYKWRDKNKKGRDSPMELGWSS